MLTDIKTNLVVEYIYFAERLACKKKRIVPPQITIEELKSAAYLGLVDAAIKYKESIGNFPNYAYYRINGAMADYLRELGWGKSTNRQAALSLDQEQEDGLFYRDLVETKGYTDPKGFFTEIFKEFPEKVRMIFESYYVEGQSIKDIAQNLNLSEGRISQIMSCYKKEIKRKWEKDEFFAEIYN